MVACFLLKKLTKLQEPKKRAHNGTNAEERKKATQTEPIKAHQFVL